MKIKFLTTLILLLLSFDPLFSQTYVGAGFAGGTVSTQLSRFDEAYGASFLL